MTDEVTPPVDGDESTVDVENPEATPGSEEETTAETETPKQETAEEKPKKPRGGFQSRIDKLTREKYELEQRAMEAEGRLSKLQPAPQEAPSRDDYENYEDYLEKKAEWIADQKAREALREEKENAAREKSQAESRQLWNQWEANKEKARGKYEDFDEVINQDIPLTPNMFHAIMESEKGADIAYYLGNHPNEIDRISQLSPARQLLEIGKLEIKSNEPKKPSTAPDPIDPVKPSGGNDNPLPNEKDSDEEWIRKRRKQVYG